MDMKPRLTYNLDSDYVEGPPGYVGPSYGYGPAVPNRGYYNGPRSAHAAALPPRPRVAVPYRPGRCVGGVATGRTGSENSPNGRDQSVELDRLGFELVTARRERLLALASKCVSRKGDALSSRPAASSHHTYENAPNASWCPVGYVNPSRTP